MLEYLATPFAHPVEGIRGLRALLAAGIMSHFQTKGRHMFSPIAHCYNGHLLIPNDESVWLDFDRKVISRCDQLTIAMMPGWSQSKGIAKEKIWASELKIPVEYIPHEYLQSELGSQFSVIYAHYEAAYRGAGN